MLVSHICSVRLSGDVRALFPPPRVAGASHYDPGILIYGERS
jgi:hypothetical protein